MKIGAAWAVVILALLVGCGTLNKWAGMADDHEVEEISEVVIEHYSGIDVDLSPHSPEADKCECK